MNNLIIYAILAAVLILTTAPFNIIMEPLLHGFDLVEAALLAGIAHLRTHHIEPLQRYEKGLAKMRVTNDSVAVTSAGASLAFPIAFVPCLVTTVAASMSMVGTSLADTYIHNSAETSVRSFMEELEGNLRAIITENVMGTVNFDHFMETMHATADPLGAIAHGLFVAGEVVEHAGPAIADAAASTATATGSIARFAGLMAPLAKDAVKVLPYLGFVFSTLSLGHSAWTFNHSSSLLVNMKAFEKYLQFRLENIRGLRFLAALLAQQAGPQ